jgi:hypothetical protein
MTFEKDFRDFVCLLNRHEVEYVLVGAYALAYHGVPRATQDFDLYVRPTPQNAARMARALEEFGFVGLDQRDLSRSGKVIMLGRPPMRIDLLTRISGVTWATASANKLSGTYGDQLVFIIGKNELLANKKASGRTKDLADLEALGGAPAKKPGRPRRTNAKGAKKKSRE